MNQNLAVLPKKICGGHSAAAINMKFPSSTGAAKAFANLVKNPEL